MYCSVVVMPDSLHMLDTCRLHVEQSSSQAHWSIPDIIIAERYQLNTLPLKPCISSTAVLAVADPTCSKTAVCFLNTRHGKHQRAITTDIKLQTSRLSYTDKDTAAQKAVRACL
jgi:hypothetical protein